MRENTKGEVTGMNTPDTIAKKIAQDLLDIRAVFFRPEEPFLWASGIKSPVYCDNRLTLTAPQVRDDVERAMAETIRREYPGAEVLMGTATAGIAHAAITAHLLGLPMGYVRAGQKDHGRQNQIEGRLEKGRKVVVVEDLISTGGSVIEVVEALRAAGAEVLGVVSIFTYGMKKGLDRHEAPCLDGEKSGGPRLTIRRERFPSSAPASAPGSRWPASRSLPEAGLRN